ncbi:MAG: PEP/pyruvate-binding domain-containing protein [Paracoccaceae bacterium]
MKLDAIPGMNRAVLHLIMATAPPDPTATAQVLGFKAYNLARMAAIGLNVPPAFVLGTGFCARPETVTPDLWRCALVELERATGMGLGDPRRPLLLSVRSGAPVSMPGMMETLLNIGLTDETLPGMVRQTGHPRLAWDAYRRLVSGFGEVVAGIDSAAFEADLDAVRAGESERQLDFAALRDLTMRHLETYRQHAGEPFPQDAHAQLQAAIAAVFHSWSSDKARSYRALRNLSDEMGTAVTVQRMVFGNGGGLSGAGVGFTRNPINGVPAPWVDFLFNAQGEDVVSGRRSAEGHEALAAIAPTVWADLVLATQDLERHFGDMQDFEFTVQDGALFMLQTRDGKRTPQATARIALDMADEGLIPIATAKLRTAGLTAEDLTTTGLASEDGASLVPVARAATAASGVVSGEIAFDEARVRACKAAGTSVILVRRDAETRDISALDLADGLLTQHGARTSHAAVVARQLGKVCLVGCEALQIDETRRRMDLAGNPFEEGDVITLDGNSGLIYPGAVRVVDLEPEALLARLKLLNGTD